MPKGQLKRAGNSVIPHAVVRYLGPATCRQTNIRPVQIRQKRAVSPRLPTKKVQQAGDGTWLRAFRRRRECVWVARSFRGRRLRSRHGCHHRCESPSRSLALVETEDTANFWVDL